MAPIFSLAPHCLLSKRPNRPWYYLGATYFETAYSAMGTARALLTSKRPVRPWVLPWVLLTSERPIRPRVLLVYYLLRNGLLGRGYSLGTTYFETAYSTRGTALGTTYFETTGDIQTVKMASLFSFAPLPIYAEIIAFYPNECFLRKAKS